jgi:hypothetical protein
VDTQDKTADGMTWQAVFELPRTDPRPVPPELAAQWDRVASRNSWIKNACDPPFEGAKVRMCRDREELHRWLEFGNWCNGAAFAVQEGGVTLCFMQQGECSDEWLVVKTWPASPAGLPYIAFESISWHYIITHKPLAYWHGMMDRLFAATPEQCRALDY